MGVGEGRTCLVPRPYHPLCVLVPRVQLLSQGLLHHCITPGIPTPPFHRCLPPSSTETRWPFGDAEGTGCGGAQPWVELRSSRPPHSWRRGPGEPNPLRSLGGKGERKGHRFVPPTWLSPASWVPALCSTDWQGGGTLAH